MGHPLFGCVLNFQSLLAEYFHKSFFQRIFPLFFSKTYISGKNPHFLTSPATTDRIIWSNLGKANVTRDDTFFLCNPKCAISMGARLRENSRIFTVPHIYFNVSLKVLIQPLLSTLSLSRLEESKAGALWHHYCFT